MRSLAGVALAIAVGVLTFAPSAHAFGILEGDTGFRGSVFAGEFEDETTAYTVDGTGIYDQAGGHPYKGITDFILTGTTEDNVDNLRVDIPPGLVPNPNGFAKCSELALTASTCPRAAQIGMVEIDAQLSGTPLHLVLSLYNVEPRADDVARFGFNPLDVLLIPGVGVLAGALNALHPVYIVGGVRDSASISNPVGSGPVMFAPDNGLFFTISDIPETLALIQSKLTFWGTPGAAAHDDQRAESCVSTAVLGPLELCNPAAGGPSPAPELNIPFLSNPTSCKGEKLSGRLFVDATPPDQPGPTASRIDSTPTLPNAEGVPTDGAQQCDDVPVDGGIDVVPDVSGPDRPVGPRVDLLVPQPGLLDTAEFATSHVKDVSVTLPPGMTINPSAANGLEACTDAQLAVDAGTPGGDACPEASDVGDVSISSPLLPDELGGNAYVGQPLTGDKYRLFVTIDGRGVSIRLKGSVKPDPATGQLTAIFRDNPELPFERLSVEFEDGPRAVLANPIDCGPKTASTQIVPWSGTAPITRTSPSFPIEGAGCPAGFDPSFGASTQTSLGGAFSPLTVRLGRPDGSQFLSGVRVDTPPGLAAKIKGVEQCAAAAAASGACPAASRIGTATTSAGAGSEPYRLSGPVYFTEGYKGAPFGMVAVIRAIAGPYDLGTVVVRQSIFVDPEDASLTVVSDPLPQILEGVPIRLRSVDVTLDKPGFAYNPTSCGTKPVGGRLSSLQGTTVDRGANLAIESCDRLAFAPKLAMQLTGPKQTKQGKHPGLRVRVTQPASQANIASAVVKLPKSLALDPDNARAICGFDAGIKANCPAKARIGTATAISPVLNRKLSGPVYFVQGIRIDPNTGAKIRTLPSLLAKLSGEIRVNLRGTTSVEGGKLVSTFASIPDAPVTRFDVDLKGGKGGVLAATGRPAICGRRQVGVHRLTGHNGKVGAQQRVGIVKPCKRPNLKIRRLRASGGSLAVRGTIARRATGKIAVSARCGKTRVAKRAKRPRKGRWATTLKLRGACADAARAKVRIAYAGGGAYRATTRNRRVTLPGGS
jgi:hypothetical protein